MKFSKTVEFDGQHICDTDMDGIDVIRSEKFSGFHNFSNMVPYAAVGCRGRWKFTVEFEPLEEP